MALESATVPGSAEKKTYHVLIVGAGLTGLILAQALRNFNNSAAAALSSTRYTYEIYERDSHAFARGGGWSLTIHWALTDLHNMLSEDIVSRISECLVNPEAVEKSLPGIFQFLNLVTGEQIEAWPIPSGVASRVSREKIISLLLEGLDVQWSKNLSNITHQSSSTATAHFTDGTSATGNLIVGCDGSRSAVRRTLAPTAYQNYRLPVRLIGLRVVRPVEEVKACHDKDIHFFQGGDPTSNAYFWHSFIYYPRSDDKPREATCQIMFSWPYKAGTFGNPEPVEMPASNEERLEWMKSIAKGWAEPFRSLVFDISADTEAREIVLEDWPPVTGAWDNRNGTVTLVGDAAHAMTMFRGEAANHGVIDVSVLTKLILPGKDSPTRVINLKEAINSYEQEMIERTHPAALKSRQACIDANNYSSVNASSPLISKRKMKD